MNIRVVLLPDEKGKILYKKYSGLLNKKFDSFFELEKGTHSHITLVHVSEMEESNLPGLERIIKKFSQSNKIQHLRFGAPRPGTVGGFIGIKFKDDKEASRLRDEIHKSSKNLFKEVSKFEDPHVTLTKFKNDEDVLKAVDLISDFPADDLIFDRIAICENGDNGTCTKILSSFSLQ